MHLDDLSLSDLDIFFSEDETYPAVWTVAGEETSVSMSVIFEETYQAVDPETEAVIMSTEPRMAVRNDKLPDGADAEDEVVVKGETFSVIEIQPEGLTSMVYLHREVA